MGEPVYRGTAVVHYTIYKYEMDDGSVKYDFYDSDQLYDTVEEAIAGFEESIGL